MNLTVYCPHCNHLNTVRDRIRNGTQREDIFDEVHRSNLIKAIANRATGKGIKGDDFKSPNLQTIIARKLSC